MTLSCILYTAISRRPPVRVMRNAHAHDARDNGLCKGSFVWFQKYTLSGVKFRHPLKHHDIRLTRYKMLLKV